MRETLSAWARPAFRYLVSSLFLISGLSSRFSYDFRMPRSFACRIGSGSSARKWKFIRKWINARARLPLGRAPAGRDLRRPPTALRRWRGLATCPAFERQQPETARRLALGGHLLLKSSKLLRAAMLDEFTHRLRRGSPAGSAPVGAAISASDSGGTWLPQPAINNRATTSGAERAIRFPAQYCWPFAPARLRFHKLQFPADDHLDAQEPPSALVGGLSTEPAARCRFSVPSGKLTRSRQSATR